MTMQPELPHSSTTAEVHNCAFNEPKAVRIQFEGQQGDLYGLCMEAAQYDALLQMSKSFPKVEGRSIPLTLGLQLAQPNQGPTIDSA